jgi:formate-dependent nitrite reductase membrane component NrfD
MALITVELALIGLWLAGLASGGRAARDAAGLVLGGPFTASFWTLVIAAGLVVPLAAEWLEWRHRLLPGRFAALLVLAGGLALRWILVEAGQLSGWAAGLAAR